MSLRRWPLGALLLASAVFAAEGAKRAGDGPVWPRGKAEHVGLDEARLRALERDLATRSTNALVILRRGVLVREWYAPGRGPRMREGTASLAKSLVGSLCALAAATDGRIAWDQSAASRIPAWRGDSLRTRIRFRDLLAHSSGLGHGRGLRDAAWAVKFWDLESDLFPAVLAETPLAFAPGTRTEYSGPAYAALSYALTASLEGAPESDLKALLRERILEPLGVPRRSWSIGYGAPFRVDGMDVYATWGGAAFTARAAARVGELLLRGGMWRGRALLDSALVAESVGAAGPLLDGDPADGPAATLGWWSNRNGAWPSLPRDAYAGAGTDGQVVLIVPSLDLVLVRFGRRLGPDARPDLPWRDLEQFVFRPIMEAVRDLPSAGETRSTAAPNVDRPRGAPAAAEQGRNKACTRRRSHGSG